MIANISPAAEQTSAPQSESGAETLAPRETTAELRDAPAERTLSYINAGATGVSALAALAAAIVAYRAVRVQVNSLISGRRATVYHSLLVAPAVTLLPAFEIEAGELLERAAENVSSAVQRNEAIGSIQSIVQDAVAVFRQRYSLLFTRLVGAANAWGDTLLQARLVEALGEVEDVSVALTRVQVGHESSASVREKLSAAVARVTAAIVHHDTDVK